MHLQFLNQNKLKALIFKRKKKERLMKKKLKN